ncbi:MULTISPECIES: aspartyl-phosphate phosphatase Spo0E family protein [Heyndrickxia]|uniref:aspartyl-phosphate phosphatase Spo0E family protein n=1 Tax=Heyndrickxia TaxID=2837504 RepID=UPI0009FB79E4|nr:aspartyl-phosphate phosphatase Spo0E family protein [Heyndrickxia shackletonii]MBB2481325.1 aspartyl-phosphate phosphatase Spo0E family protein [Bacillus sp. APMAM]NEZ01962.1 aspartyl-phosphate phosphatase Spo0E family protein [Heyndrickxia shackletonii]RTZ55279.1 aspartyl-phosphate phosphatase Spo0E family protein [Bacillus sp. SAJ1]
MKMQKIISNIEEKRKEMIELALKSSFNNEKVIEASDKLDQLLNQYEVLKRSMKE